MNAHAVRWILTDQTAVENQRCPAHVQTTPAPTSNTVTIATFSVKAWSSERSRHGEQTNSRVAQ
ncbi:hypothetical protein KCP75_23685 [Salmonella enterica subsp. enterica]|nr:hypothetical protein KCP75_23685 [Salmonella enterica subsp. enterica]